MRQTLSIPEGNEGLCFLHCAGLRERRYAHSHDEQEINLAFSGRGQYLIDGRPVLIIPGTLLWLSPEQAHLLSEESPDFMMWVAVIRSNSPVDIPSGRCTRLVLDESGFLETLCRKLSDAQNADLFNAGLLFLFRQAGRLLTDAEQASLEAFHPAVTLAARQMKHTEGSQDIAAIARHAGMSRSQLSRLFKKQTGFTLVEYRQKMQLERFLFLYGTGTKLNLMETALEAGFGSYAQFYRVFKQRFSRGPREYFGQATF